MLGVRSIWLPGVSAGVLAGSDSSRMDGAVKAETGRSTAEQIGPNVWCMSCNSASFPPGGNASHLSFR